MYHNTYKSILDVIKQLYESVLRETIKQAIDNPNSQIDDITLFLLDKLLDYKED